MPCNEYATPEDTQQIRSSMQQVAQQNRENDRYVESVIDKCLHGKITEQQAKAEIVRTYGQNPRAVREAIEKLEAKLIEEALKALREMTPKSRPVTEEDIRGVPAPTYPLQKDQFKRIDEMPHYHPNRDPGELKGFQSGEYAKLNPREHGKIMMDENDRTVQSVHLHRFTDSKTSVDRFQITVHYRDGRTEAYDQYTGEQLKDRDYSRPTNGKLFSGF
jgi:hypothetical protein